jgi:fructan beta-fructosidase
VPTVAWRSATTLPREIELNRISDTYELKFKPVKELESIQQEPLNYTGNVTLDNPLFMIEFDVDEGSQEFSLTLSNDLNEKVNIVVSQGTFSFDRTVSGVTDFNVDFPAVHQVDLKKVVIRKMKIYVDLSSVEVFINDGERVVTEIVFPKKPYDQIKLSKKEPRFTVATIASTLK